MRIFSVVAVSGSSILPIRRLTNSRSPARCVGGDSGWTPSHLLLRDVDGVTLSSTPRDVPLPPDVWRQLRDTPDARGQYDPGIAARSGRLSIRCSRCSTCPD